MPVVLTRCLCNSPCRSMVSYLVRHQILLVGKRHSEMDLKQCYNCPAFSLAECGIRLPSLTFDNPRNHHGRSISIWPVTLCKTYFGVMSLHSVTLVVVRARNCICVRFISLTLSVARTVAFSGGEVSKSNAPAHAVTAYRGLRGIAPLILNLFIAWRGVVNFTHRPPCPGKEPQCLLSRRLIGPQSRCG